jgi:DNA-binding LacI/PurR family transcriptional regulator
MHEMRISIPEDIAIIGYNNIDQAAYTVPSLTTVATPTEELGEKSIIMLINIISGNAPQNRNIMLPTKLIIRESCGCTAKNKY